MAPHYTLEIVDLADTRVKHVTVNRVGHEPFSFEIDLEVLEMHSDPARALYGIARRKVDERETREKLERERDGIRQGRHEARNFG